MKKAILLTCVVAVTFFVKCKKDDGGNNTNNNPAQDFSPMKAGTNLTYRRTTGPVSDTAKYTASSNTTTINGKTYSLIVSDKGDTIYMAKVDQNYYRYTDFGFLAEKTEELYLKGDANINDTWTVNTTYTVSGFPVPITLTYKLADKAMSKTVAGHNFTDVMHVGIVISASGFGNIGSGDFYYAKGIGMIENQITVSVHNAIPPVNFDLSTSQQLISYEIK